MRCASGSACSTYHISVFPNELCRFLASSSLGCTWMDKSSRASINLIKMGKSVPKALWTCFPRSSLGYCSINSWRDCPVNLPLATTEMSPFTAETSQLSPVISVVIGLLNSVLSLVPPQIRSFKIGWNFNGYIFCSFGSSLFRWVWGCYYFGAKVGNFVGNHKQ